MERVVTERAIAMQASARAVTCAPQDSIPWAEVVAMVRGQMRSLVGSGRELEDLTQSALERVVRGAPAFAGEAAFSTYTYRTCVRVALNHWRWWKRWIRRFDLGVGDEREAAAPGDPGTETLERERAQRLHVLLERMEPTRRLVLTLCDLEEVPIARVAEIMECPEPTVRSRLRRAREDIAELALRDPLFRDGRAS